MIEVRRTEIFADWLTALRDRTAKARIEVRIRRLSLGNPGDVKPVGEGVSDRASLMALAIGSIRVAC